MADTFHPLGPLRKRIDSSGAFVGYVDEQGATVSLGGGSGDVATDAIWNVAGDLAVGSGADTAARLAKGTALQVLQVNSGGTTLEYGASTGTGSVVRATSPTLVTPALGTPSSGTLTNCSGLPGATGITGVIPIANLATGTPTGSKFIRDDGTLQTIPGGGDALVANPLSQFAATTSAQLAGVISDETGSGALVFGTSPTLTTPNLGTPSAATLTNATGLPVATGISGLGSGVATFLATPSSANLASAVTGETGSGALVFGTSPTITTPTFSGITTADGAQVTTANAMGALAVDVTKWLNTKSISADSTFTFSGTPATANTWFSVHVINTDTAPHILTFPSSFSQATQAARTTCPIAASGQLWLLWRYDGSGYKIFGDSAYLNKFDATAAPGVGDDIADGYGPGSVWLDATGNAAYICESNGAGAAVWHALGGGGASSLDGLSDVAITSATTGHVLRHNGTQFVNVLGSDHFQPLDSDLSQIAGLSPSNDDVVQRKGGVWTNRTIAQMNTDLQGTGLVTDAAGFRTVPINSQSTAYTTVAADSGKCIYHPASDANARTFTIDSNANVAYPVGTCITFINETSQNVTIAITSDTLVLAGTGTTGSRTLAQYGEATATKVTSTRWYINGTGLT